MASPRPHHDSLAIITGGPVTILTILLARLAEEGWICCLLGSSAAAATLAIDGHVPAVLLCADDSALELAWASLAMLRSSASEAADTPAILIGGPTLPPDTGFAARIPAALDSASAVNILEQWTGPLGDHGFRNLADPYYRLVRLGGRTFAERMLRGLADHLSTVLAMPEAYSGEVQRRMHDLAGLAGTMGYADFSAACAAVELGKRHWHGDVRCHAAALLRHLRDRAA